MNIISQYKNVLMIGVILVAAFAGYSYFFTGKAEEVLTKEAVSEVQDPVDQELISLLLQLKGITLDEKFFSNPVFLSLQDFSQTLVPEPIGRNNPFEAYGRTAPK